MRTLFLLLLLACIGIYSCSKHEIIDNTLIASGKILIAIKLDNKTITEFKYDSLNRLIQIDNIYSDTDIVSEYYKYNSDNRLIEKDYFGYVENFKYKNDGKLESITKYYEPAEKEWKTEYDYKNNRINKGTTYFNGEESGYVEFKYDSRGNTIERTEYGYGTEDNTVELKYKFTYDDKINPIKNLNRYPYDVVQKNNPIYFYMYNKIMCSLPPEYDITYDYDIDGYPIKEYRGSLVFEYEYQ